MQNDVVDVLLSIGVPAGVKGFSYIYDAMLIFDEDAYYRGGKICALYEEIAEEEGQLPPEWSGRFVMRLRPRSTREIRKW